MNFVKPHYHWKEIFAMSKEVTNTPIGGVPAWMRAASTGASLGNIDSSDLKPPRLKILAGQSPEVTDGTPGALPGNFWLTIANINLGQHVTVTPILIRKSYQLWAPRGGGGEQPKGPLATATDGIHWDIPDQVFHVRFPGNPREYTWHVKKTVFENKLHKFGSSQDDNPSSKPAATLTYDILMVLHLDGKRQLCVFSSSRTGIQPTQNFISGMMMRGVDQFYQKYRIVVMKRTGPTGDPYFSYEYQFVELMEDEEIGKEMRNLYEQYKRTGFVTDLETEATEIREEKIKEWDKNNPYSDDKEEIPF